MSHLPSEVPSGGTLRDQYGRREMVYKALNAALAVDDVQAAGGVFDADGREQVVINGISTGAGAGLEGIYSVKAIPTTYGGIGATGALGDGTTDDTAPIQAAINYAKANGGTVYFPPGSYKITTALDCGTGQAKAYRITGMSNGGRGHINGGYPILLWTSGAGSGPIVKCYSVFGFELDHLHLCYDNAAYNGNMLDMDGNPSGADCTDWELHHLSFRGKLSGLHYQTATSNLRLNKAIIGDVHHCHFSDAVNGVRMGDPGGSYTVGVQFRSNTYNNNTDAHVLVGTADGESIKFDGEVFEAGNSTTAIRGATTAGDGGQNQLYDFTVENCWFGDSSAPVTWIKNLHGVVGNPISILGNRFASNSSNGGGSVAHLSGDSIWLIQGNGFEGGDIFTYVNGGAAATMVLLTGNTATVRKKYSNLSSSFSVAEWGNTYSYNGTFPQTADNTSYDRVAGSRLAIGGLTKPQQPDIGSTTDLNEDLLVGAFTNAYVLANPVDKSMVMAGKTPNPAGLKSTMIFAPSAAGTGAGGASIWAGTGPYNVLEVNGSTTQALCKLGFNGVTPVVQPTRAGQLTDSTGGAVTSTLAAGITDTVAKNAIASLAAKVNALETIIHNYGLST